MAMRRKMMVVVAALAAASALGGCGGGSSAPSAMTAVEPEQLEMLAVLGTEPEPLPEQMRDPIEQADERQGLDLALDLAQHVTTPIRQDAWIVPGRGKVCIMRPDASAAACADNPDIARRGVRVSISGNAPQKDGSVVKVKLILVLLPDRVRAVRMVRPDGSKKVRVRDNVAAYVGVPPIRVRLPKAGRS
jgi:hypothetical protein